MPDPVSSSSSSSVADEAAKDRARKVAEVLRNELEFPIEPRKQDVTTMVGNVSKEGPEPSFQTKKVLGKAIDTPKIVRGLPLTVHGSIDKRIDAIYDIVAQRFIPTSSMSIEHAFPHKEIKERQKVFLEYLNDKANQVFTTEFLQQEKMNLYFEKQTDGAAKGEIWATNYFFKACYNDIGNLWLLSVGANASKSASDAVDYIQNIFGDSFKQDVVAGGDVQRGLILSKIGGAPKITLPGLGGNDVEIYGGGKGIGQFITDWHDENRDYCLQVMKEYEQVYQSVKEKLDNIVDLFAGGKEKEAENAIRDLKRVLSTTNTFVGSYERSDLLSSSSEEDTAYDKQRREQRALRSFEEEQTKYTIFKKIGNEIVRTYFPHNLEAKEALITQQEIADIIELDKLTSNEMFKLQELVNGSLVDAKNRPDLSMLLKKVKEWALPEVYLAHEQLAKAQVENLELTAELGKAQIIMQQNTDSIQQLEEKLVLAQAEIQKQAAALKVAEDAKQELAAELKVAKDSKQELTAELKVAEDAKQELTAELKVAEDAKQELTAELKVAEDAKQELTAELKVAKDAKQELTAELKVVEDAKQELTAELKVAEDAKQELTAELKVAKDAKQELTAELKVVEDAKQELTAELKVATDTNQEQAVALQSEKFLTQRLQEEIKLLRETIKQFEAANGEPSDGAGSLLADSLPKARQKRRQSHSDDPDSGDNKHGEANSDSSLPRKKSRLEKNDGDECSGEKTGLNKSGGLLGKRNSMESPPSLTEVAVDTYRRRMSDEESKAVHQHGSDDLNPPSVSSPVDPFTP